MDNGHIEIARTLMETIAYCSGAVDRWHPMKYPKKYVNKIAIVSGKFFDKHPELLTDDNILEMCDGFEEDNEKKYGKLKGWNELNKVLDDFFNNYNPPKLKWIHN